MTMDEEERQRRIASINAAIRASGERDVELLNKHWDKLPDNPEERDVEIKKLLASSKGSYIPSEDKIGIYYQKETGVGFARKHFKFKVGSDNYKVFPEMFDNMGVPIKQGRIKELLGYTGNIGYADRVSVLAKTMRRSTGLTTHEIVLSGGSLTLIGYKVDPLLI